MKSLTKISANTIIRIISNLKYKNVHHKDSSFDTSQSSRQYIFKDAHALEADIITEATLYIDHPQIQSITLCFDHEYNFHQEKYTKLNKVRMSLFLTNGETVSNFKTFTRGKHLISENLRKKIIKETKNYRKRYRAKKNLLQKEQNKKLNSIYI